MARAPMGDVIVLLPGILGSVLQVDGRDVWAPTPGGVGRALWTLGRSVKDLELNGDPHERDDLGDGVQATRLMPDIHLIPGLWAIDGYSAISTMITSTFDVQRGRTYIEVPYDWRRDIRVAARKLAAVALPALHEQRKINPDAKLVLLGHSMGGLVARWFLECLDGWRDTRMLITFGTPFRGSLNPLDYIAHGFVKKVGPFRVSVLSDFLRSLTSIYQLLPIYPCIDQGGPELVRVAQSSGVPHLDVTRAAAAEQDFHRVIETAVGNRPQDAYLVHPVIGISQPTKQTARVHSDGVDLLVTHKGRALGGDGTVPRDSAVPIEFDGAQRDIGIYASEGHGSLQNGAAVQLQLQGLLTRIDQGSDFRDARGALGLDMADLFEVGEPVGMSVTAGTRRETLTATVVDLATRLPVAGPIPLTMAEDGFRHAVEVPPLDPGTYRVEVAGAGASLASVQSVHGLFMVADDVEPD